MSVDITQILRELIMKSADLHSLTIEVSGYCNAKCPHCPRYTDDGYLHNYIPETHLLPDIFNGIDKSKLSNLKTVYLTGATGDPLMNPHVESLIENFNFVPSIVLDTNGGIRDVNWWKNFARFKNLQVMWAVDGLKDTNHLYRIGVDFDKVQRNMEAFISAGGNAVWKFIVFKHNQHQIDKVKALAKEMGFSGVKIDRAYDYRFQGLKSWPVYVEGVYSHNISPADTFDSNSEVTWFNDNHQTQRNIRKHDELCTWFKSRSAYINVLGELIPCCMATHETTNKYPGKDEFIDLIGGDSSNVSLYSNNMDDIFVNCYGDKFNKMLSSNQKVTVCEKSCPNLATEKIEQLRVPVKHIDEKPNVNK